MSSTVTEQGRDRAEGEARAKLRMVFFLPDSWYLPRFETLLLSLLARGHEVLLALDHERGGLRPYAVAFMDRIGQGRPNFRHLQLPPSTGIWPIAASAVRRGLDYMRYLEPGCEEQHRAEARQLAPRLVLFLLVLPPFRWSWGRAILRWVLGRLEAGIPVPRWQRTFIAEQRPNVVVLSPLVDFGSAQPNYLRRAHAQRIPSVLLVAGSDDLRAKGGIREIPTLTVVSNETQAEEAVRLHGLPHERVVSVDRPDGRPEQGVVEAIEGASPDHVVRSRRGMVLRPILWVLTPLLLVLLPLLGPRAALQWRRERKRTRMRRRRDAKARAAVETKERTRAAKLEAKERADRAKAEAGAAAKAEAQAKKEGEREELKQAKESEKARLSAAKGEAKAKTEAESTGALSQEDADTEKAAARAEKAAARAEKATAKAAKAAPKAKGKEAEKGAAGARKKRRGRTSKRMRGAARSMRRGAKQTRRRIRRAYNRRYRFTYTKTIHRVPARDELPALLNARGLLGKGVEVGVKTGKYSDELLSGWRGEQLISIDPWMSVDWEEYVDRSNVSQDEFDRYYQITCERLAAYGERSDIWRMTSVDAAKRVPDHSLDFAYIDARHDYESVKEDLAAWCAKVRPGGILAGHDYVDGDFREGEFYVKSAVDEFFGEREVPVHGTEGPSAVESFPTWIVEVPEGGIEPPAQ